MGIDDWGYRAPLGEIEFAFGHNGLGEWIPRIAAVELEISGENDGPSWHWICRLKEGGYIYAHGGCDYTGWDCQSSADVHEAATRAEVIALCGQDERRVFEEMLASGETVRKACQ